MAKKHYIVPTILSTAPMTVRLGAQNAAWTDVEQGKFVKLAAESQFNLSAVGDDIDCVVSSVDSAPSDGFSIGGVVQGVPGDLMWATADGLQGTPGTGAIAIGDIVVVGSVAAKGTVLPRWARVCKATTPANVVMKWRVVSLGSAGTGAVGTDIVIERV